MKRISLLLAAMFLCGVAVQRDALAQPVPELAPVAPEQPRQRMIQVKNVPPRVMAWWIDPNNNPTPIQFQVPGKQGSGKNEDRAALTGALLSDGMKPSGVMLLPAGIRRVVAIDAQNSLLVFGTEAATRELERVVSLLDKPLRQVEVEGQFVQISAEDVKTLPIDFGTEQSPASVGVVRGNFQAQLNQLVAQKKAKVITAPRVTTFNNLTASLGSSMDRANSQPAVLGIQGEDGTFRPLSNSVSQGGNSQLRLSTFFEFAVTPTINADDTVTLFVTPSRTLRLTNSQNNSEPLWSQRLDGGRVIANVRDGDTIAVMGLTSRLFAKLEDDPSAPAANVVLFVTPRIIRRAGVDDVQPVALQR